MMQLSTILGEQVDYRKERHAEESFGSYVLDYIEQSKENRGKLENRKDSDRAEVLENAFSFNRSTEENTMRELGYVAGYERCLRELQRVIHISLN